MLLHRYFSSHAFETLNEAKLRTSRISSFNDSFEWFYATVGRITPEEAKKCLDYLLRNPISSRGLVETNQKLGNPLSYEQIEGGLNSLKGEDLVGIWPDIVNWTVLSLERRRQIMDQEARAICFSNPSRVKRQGEVLLWSHYANKSTGIRIGFEFPDGIKEPFEIVKIIYQENRPEVVFSPCPEADEQTIKAIEEASKVKSIVWEYEGEFRLHTRIDLCEKREVKKCPNAPAVEEHFVGFKREWVKSVDFGVFCPGTEIQRVVDLLKTDYPNVIRRKAEMHKTEYAFEYKQVR
jgi:Protein of unknown function (DUF2971)